MKFRDDDIYINSADDGKLQARADNQISLNIGGTDELAINATTATFGTNIVIPNAATIGSAGDADAISISAAGVVAVSNTAESSVATDGALTVAGGLGVAKDINVGDDLSLLSDAAILNFGADRDVNLTHVADTGLLMNSSMQMQFRDADAYVNSDAAGHLQAYAKTQLSLNIDGTDELALSSTTATFGTNIVIPNAATIGSAGDADAISISAAGVVAVSNTAESSVATDGALTVAGGLGVAKDINVGDDLSLLSDAAILNFGADRDVNLTHVADTGLLMNSSMQMQFRDADAYVNSDAAGHLQAYAKTQLSLNIDGTDELALSSTTATFGTNIVIPNAATIGSVGDADAISISAAGVVSVSNTAESTVATDGALTVAGGLGVAKDINVGDDLSLLSDAAILNFGADRDVKLTHVADTGLLMNSSMQMQFRDADAYVNSDAAGHLQAYAKTQLSLNIDGTDELALSSTTAAFGTNIVIPNAATIGSAGDADAISISAAGVVAVSNTAAESSVATDGALTVAGGLGVAKDVNVGDDLSLLSDAAILNFGADRDVNLTHVADTGLLMNSSMQMQFRDADAYVNSDAAGHLQAYAKTQLSLNIDGTDELALRSTTATFGTNIVIPNAATIGSAGDADAISISAAGVVAVSNTAESSVATDGALTVAGGLGVAKDINVGDDLSLLSDAAILNFGADRDVNLTHVADTGLLMNSSMQMQFRDADAYVNSDAAGHLQAYAKTQLSLNIDGTDELALTSDTATFGTNIVIPNAATIGSAGDADAISISAAGVVAVSNTAESSVATDGALTVAGGLGVAKDINVGDDLSLLSDAAILNFGADRDVNLTHVADTGLLMNSSMQMQFRDADAYVNSDAAGHLQAYAKTQLSLNIDGTDELALSSTTATFGTNIVIPNAATIGSAGDADAISISAAGVVAVSNTAESSVATDGALTVAGGLGVAKDINVGDDLSLLSDAAILNFGADRDVNLTHVADTGLLMNSSMQMQFRDSDAYVNSDAAGHLQAYAKTQLSLNIDGTDELALSSTTATFGTNIVIPNAATIGSAGDADAISISAAGVVAVSNTTGSTSSTTGALTVAGGLGVAEKLYVGDDVHFKHDGARLHFGADSEVHISHNHNTGLDFSHRCLAPAFHASSDENLKKNIEQITNIDQILDTLNGVQYNWKKGEETQEYGVIAQDVQKVMPDSVVSDSNENLAVNYNHLVGVLVAAVKDQRSRLVDLENRLRN